MTSLLGFTNVRTEFFSSAKIGAIQEELNAFLAEHDQQIIDIRMSTCNNSVEVMVIYQPLA